MVIGLRPTTLETEVVIVFTPNVLFSMKSLMGLWKGREKNLYQI